MALAPLDFVYCVQSDIEEILSVDGVVGRVDDNADGVISPTEQGYIAGIIDKATARINRYLAPIYDHSALATDHTVNEWCAIIACYLLATRRGNPAMGSIVDLYKEVIDELREIRRGEAWLDLGQRISAMPVWSNIRVDCTFVLRKSRVETPISDRKPAGFIQNKDLGDAFIVEPNY